MVTATVATEVPAQAGQSEKARIHAKVRRWESARKRRASKGEREREAAARLAGEASARCTLDSPINTPPRALSSMVREPAKDREYCRRWTHC